MPPTPSLHPFSSFGSAIAVGVPLLNALLALGGRAAWWLPSWLGWIPRLALERG